MKQFFAHYEEWEDYKNGMYCGTVNRDEEQIKNAKKVLSDPYLFKNILIDLVRQWQISSKVNLTNTGINRRAWLGAAACSFKFNVTETNTRYAWNELNEKQQFEANTIAEEIINQFELTQNAQEVIRF